MTALHNGSGQGLGAIDRPVIRESTTGYPFIQGSSIKGVLLAEASLRNTAAENVVKATFGTGGTTGYQGCAAITDAALLLFPVRSLAGTFAWATSRLALARLARFLEPGGGAGELRAAVAAALEASAGLGRGKALGPSAWAPPEADNGDGGPWDAAIRLNGDGPYCIEQLVLEAQDGGARGKVAELAVRLGELLFPNDGTSDADFWRDFFKGRLLVLHGDDFRELAEHATQVEANIKIEATGVTKDGSLRYTEYLPVETVLVSLLELREPHNGVSLNQAERLVGDVVSGQLQIGADESTGKGLVRVVCHAIGHGEEAGHDES